MVTFAVIAMLPQVRIFELGTIPRVWDMPVPAQREQVTSGPTIEALRVERAHVMDAEILNGKGSPLDHF